MDSKGTLYEKIVIYIKEGIKNGLFVSEQKLPTEMELAQLFNTSRNTVTKAMSILELEGIIYRVQGKGSFVAQSKRNGQNGGFHFVALILPFIFAENGPVFFEPSFIRGVQVYLKKENFTLIVNYIGDDPKEEKDIIEKCKNEMIEGIIMYPSHVQENISIFYDLVLENFPVVFIDRPVNNLPVTCVQSDNVKGGYEATKHLIEFGYEDIYFVSGSKISRISSVSDRYFGYCKAMKEANKSVNSNYCIEGFVMSNEYYTPVSYDENPELFKNIIKSILHKSRSNSRIGIFAENDASAYYLLKACKEMAIPVPERVGIVGFDDSQEIAARSPAPLTTVKQDFFEIGRRAAQITINKIRGIETGISEFIDVELVKKSTTSKNSVD